MIRFVLLALLTVGMVGQQTAPFATCATTSQETDCRLSIPPQTSVTTATITIGTADGQSSTDYPLDPCSDASICGMQLAVPLGINVIAIARGGQILYGQ